MRGAGALREQLVILTADAQALRVASLTRVGSLATIETVTAHGRTSGDYVTIADATPAAYNGRHRVTVTSATTCTYPVAGSPATPATGLITLSYASDAQGGRQETWRDVATIPAELMPLRAGERLQLAAIQSDVAYRFRTRRRADIEPRMRATWTPSWPPQAAEESLEILGVLPMDDGRTWMLIECARSPR